MKRKKTLIPILNVRLSLVSTLNGKIIASYDEPSHTFVRNWFNILFGAFTSFASTGSTYGAGYISSKQPGGTVQNVGFGYAYSLVAPIGDSLRGIMVGRGTTAESFDCFTLTTPIANGSGTNQLAFQAQSATTAAYTAGTLTWDATLKRVMNNNSSASISITETGLGLYTGSGNFLVSRDLLAAAVPVAAAGQLTVTYTLSLTFPG